MRRLASSLLLAAGIFFIPACGLAETHFQAAQRLLQSGNETEARRALELELAVRPRNLEARYDLAVLLERIGHGKRAAELYRRNIKLGRHLPSVVNLSAWLRSHGHNEQATKLLQKATRDFPAEAVPWYLLAGMAAQQGKKQQADTLYRKAIAADRKNGFAHLRYARFLAARGRQGDAVAQARTAVRLLPHCAPCLNIAGDILAGAGKRKQALALWQRSIALAPNTPLRHKILQALNATHR